MHRAITYAAAFELVTLQTFKPLLAIGCRARMDPLTVLFRMVRARQRVM